MGIKKTRSTTSRFFLIYIIMYVWAKEKKKGLVLSPPKNNTRSPKREYCYSPSYKQIDMLLYR